MLTLVGNSPSSGSTLLADLLDSTSYTACGPELGLFATKNFYAGELSKSILPSINASTYCRTNGVNKTNFFAYGLGEEVFSELVSQSISKEDFIQRFVERYLILRGKDPSGVLFEKTPQNINVIKQFLDFSSEHYFVSIIRHPELVIRSLIKRGFSEYVAASTWLLDVAQVYSNLNHPRLIILRYEELLENPYGIVASLIKRISGITLKENDIKWQYQQNRYRDIFERRISTWSQQTVGEIGALTEIGGIKYPRIKNMAINERYASYFDVKAVSFETVASAFDFYEDYKVLNVEGNCSPLFGDRVDLFKKWLSAVKRGEAGLNEIRTFSKPVS
jgi:hypothetical protein